MATTTQLGFPIPEDTDPLADIALAVRTLAQYVDDNIGKVYVGSSVIPVNNANTGDLLVNIPAGKFSAAPKVVAQVADTSNGWMVHVISATATVITLRAINRDAGTVGTANVTAHWIAVQQ